MKSVFVFVFFVGTFANNNVINDSSSAKPDQSDASDGDSVSTTGTAAGIVNDNGHGLNASVTASPPADDQTKTRISPEDIYIRLFQQKRISHREAVSSILALGKMEKQHRMIELMLEKMHKVMTESKIRLMEGGFTPGDPFPNDTAVQDDYSIILENTALFGDILLRLPDLTHGFLKRNKEWDNIMRWGISFANESKVFHTTDAKLLHLVAQELEIIEKDPDYVNPFKSVPDEELIEQEVDKLLKEKLKMAEKKAKRKDKLKGPRLSKPRTEL